MFKKFRGKRPYARFLDISQMTVKEYHKGQFKKNKKRYIQYIPAEVFKKSYKLIDRELREKIENGIKAIRVRAGTPFYYPKLPIKESPALYRIVAHLIGDGYAGERYVPYYANTCKVLRKEFRNDLKIFGKVKCYENIPNTVPCLFFPKVITNILRHIFHINFIRPNKLPMKVFHASEECKAIFLRALFDDEGTISTNLAISMANLNIIQEIKRLIENMGIGVGSITKRQSGYGNDILTFNIKRKTLKKFKEKIGFSHPKKSKNLDAAIKTQQRKQRTRNPRIIKRKLIKSLKKRQKSTIELANEVQLTLSYTLQFLKKFEKDGKLKRGGFKNRIIWSLA